MKPFDEFLIFFGRCHKGRFSVRHVQKVGTRGHAEGVSQPVQAVIPRIEGAVKSPAPAHGELILFAVPIGILGFERPKDLCKLIQGGRHLHIHGIKPVLIDTTNAVQADEGGQAAGNKGVYVAVRHGGGSLHTHGFAIVGIICRHQLWAVFFLHVFQRNDKPILSIADDFRNGEAVLDYVWVIAGIKLNGPSLRIRGGFHQLKLKMDVGFFFHLLQKDVVVPILQ